MPTQVGFEPCGRQPLGNLGNLFLIAQSAQNHQADAVGQFGHDPTASMLAEDFTVKLQL